MNWMIALEVFASALVADWIWAKWTIATSKLMPKLAAATAMGIILIGIVSIDAYIESRWYVIPAAIGGGLSTYATVWHQKRKDIGAKEESS